MPRRRSREEKRVARRAQNVVKALRYVVVYLLIKPAKILWGATRRYVVAPLAESVTGSSGPPNRDMSHSEYVEQQRERGDEHGHGHDENDTESDTGEEMSDDVWSTDGGR